MTVAEKIRALAQMYDTSDQSVRMFIAEGRIPGAIAIRHRKRHAFIFSPELIKKLEGMK